MENALVEVGAIGRLDRELFLAANRSTHRPNGNRRRLYAALTRIGDTDVAIVHALALVALAPAGQHLRFFATIGGAMIAATLITQVLKRAVRRSRPSVGIAGFVPATDPPDAYSFPSGHTSGAFSLATAVCMLNPILGTAEVGLALAIGLSRIRLGAHYPIDVLAGMAVGTVCGVGWAKAALPLFS